MTVPECSVVQTQLVKQTNRTLQIICFFLLHLSYAVNLSYLLKCYIFFMFVLKNYQKMCFTRSVVDPLLGCTCSAVLRFPSGVQTRTAVCLKTLSLMALICLRIGREMVQQHMADTLRRFFAVFSLLHSLQPQVHTHTCNT